MVRKKNKSFRLLMEYHSFLYKIGSVYNKVVARKVSVSLRSYIHSYLSTTEKTIMVILLCFRLLTELYSFLQRLGGRLE